MRKQTAIWTTKTGHRLRICDMDDSHLLNSIRLLRRTAKLHMEREIAAAYAVGSTLNGEMAQFYCDLDINRMENTSVDEFLDATPAYARLVAEAERRGLEI